MSSAVSSDAARHALVQTALETDSAGVEALAASSKTERCGDRWLGGALYTLWANGCYDESATSTLDQSEITRIGRYLFAEDGQGFIGYREYADERSAELFLGDQTYARETCPRCNSTDTVRNGSNREGARVYQCRACEMPFAVYDFGEESERDEWGCCFVCGEPGGDCTC